MTELDASINDFAVRSFRDVGDADYIAARMACRAALVIQFLWASQQAVEKYLKCILLLNRIPAKKVGHDLVKSLTTIKDSGKLSLNLSDKTNGFIERLNELGTNRYFEVSTLAFGKDLVTLDRATWELRRYCTHAEGAHHYKLRDAFSAPRVRIPNGYLENIMDDAKNPAREPLLWQNAFFGKRARKIVRLKSWYRAYNAPLALNPHILEEVLKYVYMPKSMEAEYREWAKLHDQNS